MFSNFNNSFQKSFLTNGITLVTERIPHVRSVSLGIWVKAGSRDEPDEKCGISHFIEHMMFKGTATRSTGEIASSLEDVGGQLNAFTSKELSCYSAHILDVHLPLAAEVLSDILMNSLFNESEIAKEKQVILNEIDTYKESPEDMVFEHFYRHMYPAHPLGNLIYGTAETISGFSRADILAYLRKNYTQKRIVVAAAGNVVHTALEQLIQNFIKELAHFNPPVRHAPDATPMHYSYTDVCAQTHTCIGALAYPYAEPKKFPLLLLDTILGAGMSSRLFQNVREKYGVAYNIYSFVDFYSDTGILGVYMGTDPADTERCLELIFSELKTLREQPLTALELDKIKSQLKGNLVLGLESTSSCMHRIAKMELYLETYISIDEILDRIDAVTVGDVCDVAGELLAEERLYVTQLRPNSAPKL